jgi:transcription elongation factor Elf1
MENNNDDLIPIVGVGTQNTLYISFTCEICNEVEVRQTSIYYVNKNFQMCNNCLKDIREIILSKRSNL